MYALRLWGACLHLVPCASAPSINCRFKILMLSLCFCAAYIRMCMAFLIVVFFGIWIGNIKDFCLCFMSEMGSIFCAIIYNIWQLNAASLISISTFLRQGESIYILLNFKLANLHQGCHWEFHSSGIILRACIGLRTSWNFFLFFYFLAFLSISPFIWWVIWTIIVEQV